MLEIKEDLPYVSSSLISILTASNSLDTYVVGGTGGWGEGYFLIHAVTYHRTNKTRPIQLTYSYDKWTGFSVKNDI